MFCENVIKNPGKIVLTVFSYLRLNACMKKSSIPYEKKSGVKQPHDFHYPLRYYIHFKLYEVHFSLLLLTEDSFSQSGVPS